MLDLKKKFRVYHPHQKAKKVGNGLHGKNKGKATEVWEVVSNQKYHPHQKAGNGKIRQR